MDISTGHVVLVSTYAVTVMVFIKNQNSVYEGSFIL